MRVLFLSSLWPPVVYGGAELYAARLAQELADAGHDVGAVTLGVEGDLVVAAAPAWPYRLETFEQQPGWKRALFQARDQYNRSAARTVQRAIRSFRPDVVHSNVAMGMSIAALSAPTRNGVAHVHTIHDHWLLCRRTTLQRADGTDCESRCVSCRLISAGRLVAARRHFADVVIAVSEAVAAAHRDAGFLAERIRVIRNPIDAPATLAPRAPIRTPVAVGYLGALSEAKGAETLAQAAQALGSRARFVVGGVGPLADMLSALSNVECRGWVEGLEKEAFFADIDVLVVPSRVRDSAPTVVNEAVTRRVPIIGSAVGGIPELVPAEQSSLLFPPGDTNALVARIETFVAAPRQFTVTGPAERYGWAEHVELVRAAYDDAIRIRKPFSRN